MVGFERFGGVQGTATPYLWRRVIRRLVCYPNLLPLKVNKTHCDVY